MKFEFKIEKGVEMPKVMGRGRWSKFPFDEMDIHDSFAVIIDPYTKENIKSIKGSIAAAVRRFNKLNIEKKMTARMIQKGAMMEYRVWRIR